MAQGRIFPQANEGVARRQFGRDANRISTITINLATVASKKEIRIGGSFLWAADATDGLANTKVSFSDSEADQGITFKRGAMIRGLQFPRIFITHAAQAGKTITLAYAVEDIDNISVENPADFFSSVSLTKLTARATVADLALVAATLTVILAADVTRERAFISNVGANELRIGDSNAAAARGQPVQPGETAVLSGTAEIRGFSTLGTTVAIYTEND